MSVWTKGTFGATTLGTRVLDNSTSASTVDYVWLVRLLKISLVAVVLILLATFATGEPGGTALPIPNFLEEVVQQAINRVTDELP